MKAARKKAKRAKRAKRAQARSGKRSRRRSLRQAMTKFLPKGIFTGASVHGNTKWAMFPLVMMAVVWAWVDDKALVERFDVAGVIVAGWFPNTFVATSYQGFIKALSTHNQWLLQVTCTHLRQAMIELSGPFWKVAGFVAFAVDGTKIATPWTMANERELGKKGRKPKGKCKRKETDIRPQASLTLMYHLGLGMPWAWKHGGVVDSERGQFRDMLPLLPKFALLIADAGFTGYELWRDIIDHEHDFLIRVGANVELLKNLGVEFSRENDIVWLWPDRKRKSGEPPLKLRLITLKLGKQPIVLVTTILDAKRLSDKQAQTLYTARWGVECCFRTFKQTFERTKLRGYKPDHIAAELDWSLVSMWLLGLLATEELIAAKIAPCKLSYAKARRQLKPELRRLALQTHKFTTSEFQTATKDTYQRTAAKKARHDQRKKHDPPCGTPTIRPANKEQRRDAKAICAANA